MSRLAVTLGFLGLLALVAGVAGAQGDKEGGGRKDKRGGRPNVTEVLFKDKDHVTKDEFIKFFMDRPRPGGKARPGGEGLTPEERKERLGKLFDSYDTDHDKSLTRKEWEAGRAKMRKRFEERRKEREGGRKDKP